MRKRRPKACSTRKKRRPKAYSTWRALCSRPLCETALQFADGGPQIGLQRIVENLFVADGRQDPRFRVLKELIQLRFESPAILHRDIVEQALGGGKDNGHLFFDRQRPVL